MLIQHVQRICAHSKIYRQVLQQDVDGSASGHRLDELVEMWGPPPAGVKLEPDAES